MSDRKDGGWQPIETAPKDGTYILGWNDELLSPVVMFWKMGPQYQSYWATAPAHYVKRPTHWMPLPPPPTDAMLAQREQDNG